MRKHILILLLSSAIVFAMACSENDDGSTDGDMDAESNSSAESDKDIIENEDQTEIDDESDAEIAAEVEHEIEVFNEEESETVESAEEEGLENEGAEDDPYAACQGSCVPDTDMQYCITASHYCYCSPGDNSWHYFPPEKSDDRFSCECLTIGDVDYCDFGPMTLCDLNICEWETDGKFKYCVPFANPADEKGICQRNYSEDEQVPESDCTPGEPCDGEDSICLDWGLESTINCFNLCELPEDTCGGIFPCAPYKARNGKTYPFGICTRGIF